MHVSLIVSFIIEVLKHVIVKLPKIDSKCPVAGVVPSTDSNVPRHPVILISCYKKFVTVHQNISVYFPNKLGVPETEAPEKPDGRRSGITSPKDRSCNSFDNRKEHPG